jgi:HlyD family secretion protein
MTSPTPPSRQHLSQILSTAAPGRLGGKWRWIAAVVLLVVALLAWLFLRPGSDGAAPRYVSEPAVRGSLTVTVAATGNLQPTNQVDVGSELSGTVQSVFVDDNSQVKKGHELARLDVSRLNDQIAKSRAALLAAEAGVKQAEATAQEARTNLGRLQEVSRLSGGKVPSKTEMASSEANLARAQASLTSAHAAVTQAQAALSSDATNLTKASIRSPINGVVLLRKVEPGQTVAASLQAPVLFTLAEDLAQMELQVNVDEADVGQVRTGQPASFSVDAWPNRKYPASIKRVRFGSQTTDGVVSYLTVLQVDNSDLSLRPGMTASAEITTTARENALLVPNAALRFSPPRQTKADSGGIIASLLPRIPRGTSQRAQSGGNNGGKDGFKQIWVLVEGQPQAVKVKVGVSNGRQTEILEGKLEAGTQVITDSEVSAK